MRCHAAGNMIFTPCALKRLAVVPTKRMISSVDK